MILKTILRALLYKFTLPIRAGVLKGFSISLASGTRFIRGEYETEKTLAFCENIAPGDFVLDVGGHIGYFAMLAAKLAGSTGLIWTFEPAPRQYKLLRLHIAKNGLNTIVHFDSAVSSQKGQARFDNSKGSGTGHLSSTGALQVSTVAIDNLELPRRPSLIKIDIEGGEVDALLGMQRTIAVHRPIIMVAVHSAELHKIVREMLESWHYSIVVLNPAAIKGDMELLAQPLPSASN
jgi:FkbM family methyltransferase